MTKQVNYYEVEIQFNAPTGAVVPVTAETEEEAKAYAQYLFRDYDNLKVVSVNNISSTDVTQPAPSMLN
jgi:hypothetical protein